MKNGFYIWKAKDQEESMHPLYLDQVVEVIEGVIWVTGMIDEFNIEDALKFGSFGDCVLRTVQVEHILVDT